MRGEIITTETEESRADGSDQGSVESSAIIPCSPPAVWDAIAGVQERSKLIPGVKTVRIVRIAGNREWVAYHLRWFLVSTRYQLIDTLYPEQGRITWTLDKSVDHDIADTTGSWQVALLPSGQHTLVRYRAWIDTGRPVPRFIADFFIRRSLPKIVGGLRSEVQRRFQR
jgi:hypothetical protein